MGLSEELSRAAGIGRANELSLTSNFLGAMPPYEWRLVNAIVATDELLPLAQTGAEDMANIEPGFIQTHKQSIGDGYAAIKLGKAFELEQRVTFRTNAWVSADPVERRRARMQARSRLQ